jgi:hypothetical protein
MTIAYWASDVSCIEYVPAFFAELIASPNSLLTVVSIGVHIRHDDLLLVFSSATAQILKIIT